MTGLGIQQLRTTEPVTLFVVSSSRIRESWSAPPLYTIGYGAQDMDAFLQVLRANGIAYLIDVRSKPYSRHKPEFPREALQHHLQEQGIRYVFMGDASGGQPPDPDCSTDGKVDYEKCRGKTFFKEGISRLRRAWEQGLSAVSMCSEVKYLSPACEALVGTVEWGGIGPALPVLGQPQGGGRCLIRFRQQAGPPRGHGPPLRQSV